jgi:hypothetical protein
MKIIFGLTVKLFLIFGKRFTVFKTVNRFPKLNSSSLHARLISDCWNSAMVGRRNLGGTGIRQHPAIKILPALESGDIRPPSPDAGRQDSGRNPSKVKSRSDLAGFGWIWPLIRPDLIGSGGVRQKSGNFGRIRPNMLAEIRQ